MNPIKNRSKRGGCRYTFPERLFDLLQDIDIGKPELSSIISWHPNGKSFQVHDRKAFEKVIQKKYFNQSKFASFCRQLNLWGFERIPPDHAATGDEQDSSESLLYGGSFFHPLFQRHDRRLCCTMSRVVGGDESKRRPGSLSDLSPTSIRCTGDDASSNISSNNNADSSHKKKSQEGNQVEIPSGGFFVPTMSSSLIDSLGSVEPIPVHDCIPFDLNSIGAVSVSPSQEEFNHEAVVRRGNNMPSEERSMTSAEDTEFKLLIDFLSANDEHLYKYLFELD